MWSQFVPLGSCHSKNILQQGQLSQTARASAALCYTAAILNAIAIYFYSEWQIWDSYSLTPIPVKVFKCWHYENVLGHLFFGEIYTVHAPFQRNSTFLLKSDCRFWFIGIDLLIVNSNYDATSHHFGNIATHSPDFTKFSDPINNQRVCGW